MASSYKRGLSNGAVCVLAPSGSKVPSMPGKSVKCVLYWKESQLKKEFMVAVDKT